ncbi:unnamed protein product [Euphydryas editha]|uniref:Uncharacterized protein n=1 Tax=Euphydryas editha TaxID=104508 RepID=A0AAU9U580_EUPED|nr:unnamed protein product [Euphydryas editha]
MLLIAPVQVASSRRWFWPRVWRAIHDRRPSPYREKPRPCSVDYSTHWPIGSGLSLSGASWSDYCKTRTALRARADVARVFTAGDAKTAWRCAIATSFRGLGKTMIFPIFHISGKCQVWSIRLNILVSAARRPVGSYIDGEIEVGRYLSPAQRVR